MCSFVLKLMAVCAVTLSGGVQLLLAAEQAATVRHIAVTGDGQNLDVEITVSKQITPRTQFVNDPDRLIVDLPEARPDAGLRKILVQRGELRDVRVGLLSANPPITRVVLDLTAVPEFRVLTLANRVVVRLGKESPPEAPPAPPVAPTSNPTVVVKPAETTSSVAIVPLSPPVERGRARWIMPILVTITILAMLVISLVVHIQNRRGRRGT